MKLDIDGKHLFCNTARVTASQSQATALPPICVTSKTFFMYRMTAARHGKRPDASGAPRDLWRTTVSAGVLKIAAGGATWLMLFAAVRRCAEAVSGGVSPPPVPFWAWGRLETGPGHPRSLPVHYIVGRVGFKRSAPNIPLGRAKALLFFNPPPLYIYIYTYRPKVDSQILASEI